MNSSDGPRQKAWLVGVGLDNDDGHTRLTRGENFILAGGSEETHDHMTEGAIKLNEKLQQRGKALEEVNREEFTELAREAGLLSKKGD
jgi:hypothetical protein